MKLKRVIKITGNILMAAALAFVVKKLFDMDISFSDLKDDRVLISLMICFIFQTMIIIVSCYPWLMFIRSLSGRKVPYSAAMPVYTQSNLYKYLPGNVFQYVGRNKLAADMEISHVDVACATVLDVFFCVFWTGVVSVMLLGGSIAELFDIYGRKLLIAGAAGILAAAAVTAVMSLKFRGRLREYLSRYSKAFEKSRRPQLLSGIFYYFLHNCVSAAMYFACLSLIVPQAGAGALARLTGAFLFAWIIGFVTPGAPGGIGIREGVMLLVCGERYMDRIVLFVLVMRVASVFADVAAFIFGRAYSRFRRS